jgi:hypothetical protein
MVNGRRIRAGVGCPALIVMSDLDVTWWQVGGRARNFALLVPVSVEFQRRR